MRGESERGFVDNSPPLRFRERGEILQRKIASTNKRVNTMMFALLLIVDVIAVINTYAAYGIR